MSELGVRLAAAADVAAVDALAKSRPFTAKWSAKSLAEELTRPDSLFVVADDGMVKGYALARLPDAEARLMDFATAQDGKGIGRALWRELVRGARARGAARLTLEVSQVNARALDFYAKAGAKVVGRRPKFYNDGSDAVLLDLDIP